MFEPPERFNLATHFLDRNVEEGRGERIALHTDSGALTYSEVADLANRFGRILLEAGLHREDRVMLALPDDANFVGAFFGTLKIGAVVVMVNPQLKPANLAALFDYTGVHYALVDRTARETFEEAVAEAAQAPEISWVDEALERRLEELSPELDAAPTHRDDPAIWLFSGGTTGLPKAVVQSHASFSNTTECYAKTTLGYNENDVTISVPKLYFGYATGSNLLFPFSVGASSVLFSAHPTPEALFEKIRQHRPTILINVPTMVNQMVSHPDAANQDLSSLRFATSAGEALPIPLYEQWKSTFDVELLDGLGTAEMWHVFLTNRPGDVKPGTLGRVVEGFEIRVCDEDGQQVADDEVGRLWVRGNSRALGYWRNMEQTCAAFRGEWFVGGDLVQRDSDGYVTYCGRGDDVLKVGGKWLAPQEVESCLMRHEAVEECAVVGVENEKGLTKPIAFVLSPSEAPDLEATLKQHCLDRLDAYKHPRRVVRLDSFPRTHLGKIDRGALKKTVLAQGID